MESGDAKEETSKEEEELGKAKDLQGWEHENRELTVNVEKPTPKKESGKPGEANDSHSQALEAEDSKLAVDANESTLKAEGTGETKAPRHLEDDKEEYREISDDGWEDILGSGRLRKRVLKEGAGDRPDRGDAVKVSVKGFFQETQFDSQESLEFFVSEGEAVQALDLVVCLMNTGEVCEVMADPEFSYGDLGLPPVVPPKAAVRFEVELMSHDSPVPVADIQPVEKRQTIGRRKQDRGNFWFSRQNYHFAVQCYRKAGEFFDDERIDLEVPVDRLLLAPDLQSLLEYRVKAFNNLALAQMKLEAWQAALAALAQVLKIEPNNEKALYRKSKVLTETYRLEEAIGILRRISRLYPQNATCKVDLARLVAKQKKSRLNEEMLSKKMLGLDKYEAEQNAAAKAVKWKILMTSLAVGITGIVIGGVTYFGTSTISV